MLQETPFTEWLRRQVTAAGGWSAVMERAETAFTSGALQGWLRGAIPGPRNQTAIAKVFRVPLQTVKDLVWRSWEMRPGSGPSGRFLMIGPPVMPPVKIPSSRLMRAHATA